MDNKLTAQELRMLLVICQTADPMHVFLPQVATKLTAQLQELAPKPPEEKPT